MRFAAIILALCAAVGANAQEINPMSQAVMQVYDEMLKENPGDYETLLSRAQAYYSQDEYLKALDDVSKCLRYAPAGNKEIRFNAYRLRAAVNERLARYHDAFNDINSALAIVPGSMSCINSRAAIEYEIGKYSEAKADYTALLRAYPRNQEAMFGLARVAVKENNIGLANDYADRAVDFAPQSADSYIRRASVRTLMGNAEGAVDDYIVALTTDDAANSRALSSLVQLANSDYPAVINGLSRAIRQAPRVGMFYYIRGAIAEAHNNFTAAVSDYDKILNDKLYSYAGLNSSLAKCFFALGQYDTALANADYAISATAENAPYYALKARILSAMGEHHEAISSADKALAKAPGHVEALRAKAEAQTALGYASDASVLLAEALLTEPEDVSTLMQRAWLCEEKLGQHELAKNLWERVAEVQSDPGDVTSLRGFALLKLGREDEADSWMNSLLTNQPDNDGLINYYGACYFASKGSMDRAADCMERSLQSGYSNYRNWVDVTGPVTVGELRNNPRFQKMMENYAPIFNR